jgi:CBS domain-containing protein
MKDKEVNEVMIPLSDYLTVSKDDFFINAVTLLQEAQTSTKFKYKHKAVLVLGKDNKICGKVSIFDMLKALEPKYRKFEHPNANGSIGLSRFGFNNSFLYSLLESHNLWDESLEELVKKSSKIKMKDIMYTPSEAEFVDEDAPIAEAVHQFILGCHQSLLVVKDGDVTGVLRLSDIFDLVCDLALKK